LFGCGVYRRYGLTARWPFGNSAGISASVTAGVMISEFTVLMKTGHGLETLTRTIHPYPTQAEVIKKVGNAWRKANFTERQKNILKKWFAWTR